MNRNSAVPTQAGDPCPPQLPDQTAPNRHDAMRSAQLSGGPWGPEARPAMSPRQRWAARRPLALPAAGTAAGGDGRNRDCLCWARVVAYGIVRRPPPPVTGGWTVAAAATRSAVPAVPRLPAPPLQRPEREQAQAGHRRPTCPAAAGAAAVLDAARGGRQLVAQLHLPSGARACCQPHPHTPPAAIPGIVRAGTPARVSGAPARGCQARLTHLVQNALSEIRRELRDLVDLRHQPGPSPAWAASTSRAAWARRLMVPSVAHRPPARCRRRDVA